MPAKPITSQACNTQPCQQSVPMAYNGGWGGVTVASFVAPAQPKSIRISGNCDDWAIIWINGVVIYNPGGCSCGGSCCANFNLSNYNLLHTGTNTIQFQCNDQCGGGSGGSISIVVDY